MLSTNLKGQMGRKLGRNPLPPPRKKLFFVYFALVCLFSSLFLFCFDFFFVAFFNEEIGNWVKIVNYYFLCEHR